MFCGEHDLVCCTICFAVKHRSCKGVEYIPDIAKGLLKRQDKDKTETSLEEVKDELQNLKSKMLNELKELSQQRDGILDDIQKFKKRIIDRVEELEKKSAQEVNEKHKEIADDIIISSKKVEEMLKDIKQQLEKLKQFKSNKEAQLFVDIKVGEEKISKGIECAKEATAKQMGTLLFEVNSSIEVRLHAEQSLGELTWISAIADTSAELPAGVNLPTTSAGPISLPTLSTEEPAVSGVPPQSTVPNVGTITRPLQPLQATSMRTVPPMTVPHFNPRMSPQSNVPTVGPFTRPLPLQATPIPGMRHMSVSPFYPGMPPRSNVPNAGTIPRPLPLQATPIPGMRPMSASPFYPGMPPQATLPNLGNVPRPSLPLHAHSSIRGMPPMSVSPSNPEARTGEKAIVRNSYNAETGDELTIEIGDVINVLDKQLQHRGWWKGELNGRIGVFPYNFVELVKNIVSPTL